MLTRQPPPPDFEWTAESIRSLRAHLGHSQAALARELGIRQQTVSEWETGMYKPRGASVTILNLLAVSSGFQFDRVPPSETHYESPGPGGNAPAPRPRPSGVRPIQASPPREVRGPRTHPDWIRTSSMSRGAANPRTRNLAPRQQSSTGFTDGEIPM